MKDEKELDKPYRIRSGFKGTQPGLSKRQMLSIMKIQQQNLLIQLGQMS